MQQGLHITASIHYQQNVNRIVEDSVNNSVRFEENFAVLANPERQQFFGKRATRRRFGQAGENLLDAIQEALCFPRCIVTGDIIKDLFEIMYPKLPS